MKPALIIAALLLAGCDHDKAPTSHQGQPAKGDAPLVNVPDGGATAWLMVVAVMAILAIKRITK